MFARVNPSLKENSSSDLSSVAPGNIGWDESVNPTPVWDASSACND